MVKIVNLNNWILVNDTQFPRMVLTSIFTSFISKYVYYHFHTLTKSSPEPVSSCIIFSIYKWREHH